MDRTNLPPRLQSRSNRIFCVGKNYRAHVQFMGDAAPQTEPLIFTKPSTALAFPGESLWFPPGCEELHPEAELVLIVGQVCRDLPPEEAPDALWGFGSGLDMTDRGVQKKAKEKGWPWDRAKGFDGSAALGDWVARDPKAGLPQVFLKSEGELLQEVDPTQMTHDLGAILASLSARFTLLPGDLIFTGAPAGTAPVQPGAMLELSLGERPAAAFEVSTERPGGSKFL